MSIENRMLRISLAVWAKVTIALLLILLSVLYLKSQQISSPKLAPVSPHVRSWKPSHDTLHPDLLARIRKDLAPWARTGIGVYDMRNLSRMCKDSNQDPQVTEGGCWDPWDLITSGWPMYQ